MAGVGIGKSTLDGVTMAVIAAPDVGHTPVPALGARHTGVFGF